MKKFLLLLVFLLGLSACGAPAPETAPTSGPVWDPTPMYGVWKQAPDAEPLADIRANGTCLYLGQEGTWAPVESIYHDNYIEISVDGTVQCGLSYVPEEFAANYIINDFVRPGYYYNFTTIRTVALTKENFWDYFEIVEDRYVKQKEFGDPDCLMVVGHISIREEYAGKLRLYATGCTVELEFPTQTVPVTVDWDRSSYEAERGEWTSRESVTVHLSPYGGLDRFEGADFSGVYRSVSIRPQEETACIFSGEPADITILAIQGTLAFGQ